MSNVPDRANDGARVPGMKMTVPKEHFDKLGKEHYAFRGSNIFPAGSEEISGHLRGKRTKTNPEAHVKVRDMEPSALTLPQEHFNNLSTYVTNRAASGEGARVNQERTAKEEAGKPRKVIKIDGRG